MAKELLHLCAGCGKGAYSHKEGRKRGEVWYHTKCLPKKYAKVGYRPKKKKKTGLKKFFSW